MIIFGAFVVFESSIRMLGFLQNFSFSDLLWVAGSELPKDQNGFTNILLLGVGGKEHESWDGGELTDTIIVASIDQKTKSVVMLSIPRDFYVETDVTSGRINEVVQLASEHYKKLGDPDPRRRGIETLEKEIEEIFHIQIDRFLQVDFRAFVETIDALQGIDIDVEKTIDDPEYPTPDWKYERFYLPAGKQHLDGATALKFARSRHSSSDFDRSRRQRQIISAVLEKAGSLHILTSPGKLQEMYHIVEGNIHTNFSFREMISLANIGYTFPRENLLSFGLNDDPKTTGGFLVTPARELFSGAFVLVPFLNLTKDKYEHIRVFVDVILHHRDLNLQKTKIHISNASQSSGLAASTKAHLERFGIPVETTATSDEKLEKTEIRYENSLENNETAMFLTRFLSGTLRPYDPESQQILAKNTENEKITSSDISIFLGKNHQNFRIPLSQNPDSFSSSP